MRSVAQSFQNAERWVKRCARPLEAARWEYAFARGPRERVLEILSAYQNSDGGFGHGMEPDFWLPSSSPMASWAAARILFEVGAEPESPLVARLVEYLSASQGEDGMWPAVLPETSAYPHAPWWEWQEGAKEEWAFNPSVELAAFLIYWTPLESKPAQQGWKTVQLAVERLMNCTAMEMHEAYNYVAAADLLAPYKAELAQRTGFSIKQVQEKIKDLAAGAMKQDPSQWAIGYKALPLNFVQSPESFLYPAFEGLVQQNLAFYAEQADENGLWTVPWDWPAYPLEFAIARRYWQGIMALERYRIFRSFGWL